jgi:1-phosphofructokinase
VKPRRSGIPHQVNGQTDDRADGTDAVRGDGRVAVFAPGLLLTITIEQHEDVGARVHVHAGGQGYWVARLVTRLGADALLCSSFGGEPGRVLRPLVDDDGLEVRGVDAAGETGAYVHDRRRGDRDVVVETEQPPLDRHELDELYTATLGAAIEAGVCVLAGSRPDTVVPHDVYRRLAADLRSNDVTVVADLSGEQLRAALAGGVDLLKVSHDELLESGWATGDDRDSLLDAMGRVIDAGARELVVSCAEEPALAFVGGSWFEVTTPSMEVIDHRGAGDSMTAALAVAKARGFAGSDALALAAGAGALNVTRHGLGSGDAATIAQLARRVDITGIPLP